MSSCPVWHSSTIAIVNDDVIQATFLKELLIEEGLETLIFSGAENALASMDPGNPPDLIITDIYMPGIDGWRFCRLLRSSEYKAFNDVPILVVSAIFSGEEVSNITADSGANAFLSSPVDGNQLISQVRLLLSNECPERSPRRALIVEDSQALSDLLKDSFETSGYMADVAFCVAEAVLACKKTSYDVVVLDYHLPDGKGDELLAVFKKDQPACVSIIMTSDPGPELSLRFMRQGAAAYIRKPFDPSYLIELCARAQREHALLRVEDLLEERTRELIESETRYRMLVENLNDVIYRVRPDGVIEYVSPSSEKVFGYPPSELVGRLYDSLLHPEDKEKIHHAFEDILAGKLSPSEYRILNRNGAFRWVRTSSSLLKEGDKTVGIHGVMTDITESKQTEAALREEQELLEYVLNATGTGVDIIDADYNLHFVNKSWQEFYGAPTGRKCYEYFNGLSEPCQGCGIPRALETKQLVVTREVLSRENNRPVEVRIIPFQNHKGQWLVAEVNIDITERKRAEQSLRESEERFRAANNASLDSLLLLRSERDETGEVRDFIFEDVNHRTEKMLHMSCSQLLGKRLCEELPINREAGFFEKYKEVVDTGVPLEEEFFLPETHVPAAWYYHQVVKVHDGIFICHRDITERKQAEVALKESEERFKALHNASFGGIAIHDKGVILDCNKGMSEMTGYSLEELTGMNGLLLIAPQSRNEVMANIEAGYEKPYEAMGIRKNGEEYHLRLEARNVPYKGKMVRTVEFRDITEGKRSEEALQQSDRRLNDVIDFLPDATLAIDNEKKVIVWNKAIERITGIKAQDMLGKGNYEYTIPFYGERRPQLMDLVWEDDKTIVEKYPYVNREGEVLMAEAFCSALYNGRGAHVFAKASPLHDQNGNIVGAIESIRDITERKHAEVEMARLVSAIDQSVECIVMTDHEGTIQYVNPAFEKITGYSREEAIGQNPSVLKSGVHDEAFYKDLWDTITNGKIWYGRFVNKRKDGILYREEASISPIRDNAGKIVNFVAVKRDITKEVELEAQLLQAQKMEAVGLLAGGIAHDLNNLLTPILGYAEMLIEDLPGNDPRNYELVEIQKAGESAKALTRQLLAFSRKQVMEMKPLDLSKVITNFKKILRRTIRENIDLKIRLQASSVFINADIGQIEQIIMNLAVNAQDAMLHGGSLTLATEEKTIDETYLPTHPEAKMGRYVMLEVSDTGTGIDKETMSHIFEPFYTTKEMGKGTGLGLSTVYGIVIQHAGFINVYSESGKGTTFRIYFPQIVAETEINVEKPQIKKWQEDLQGTETIVLIEDNDQIRELACTILREKGYTVISASDGQECLDILSDYDDQIDLVLTDVIMPGMNGKDLHDKLLLTRPGLPVIYMSGYTDDALSHHGILEKDVHLIHKPFNKKELTDKVREVLDRSSH